MRYLLLVFALAAVALGWLFAADTPTKRTPWTTSTIVGSPEPPPRFTAAVPFAGLKFDKPVVLTRIPGSNRFAVGQEHGVVFTFENKPNATAEPFADLKKAIKTVDQHPGAKEVGALFGMVFDPDFAKNQFCYICYTLVGKKGEANLPDGSRVSRFKVTTTGGLKLDPASEEILITFLQGGHNGCDLHFGPDGYLYFSTGDATDPNPPDKFHTGQDVSDLLSSVLRIDVRKKDPGKNYAIPPDNPFVGQSHDGKPVRGEIWSYGFRNPWRMSFDRATGDLWVGDVGWESWEMVHKLDKGSNHGWSVTEARQAVNTTLKLGPTPVRPPVIELSHAIAGSVTGGYVYRGKKHPSLVGKYVFGDWMTRRLWAATITNGELVGMEELTRATVRVVGFGEDDAGELYFIDYDTGMVHTLEPNPSANVDSSKFPRTLSASGLFADVSKHTPAPGVYPFEINAHQWQDYASSEYLAAFPGTSAATDYETKKTYPNDVTWRPFHMHLPTNGVLVKTLSLETERGNPKSRKRIETQLLHYDGTFVQGYTYMWRDDQTDADLVPVDGGEKTIVVKDPTFGGGTRPHNWTFASRVQCGQCHNTWAGYSLGFTREQLSKEVDTPTGKQNQLIHFSTIGLINRVNKDEKPRPPFKTTDLMKIEEYADPAGTKKSLADRARAYLHVNCGHCHRFGGGGGVEFHVDMEADLKHPKLWDCKPSRGGFDIPDARILAPGEPYRSVLFYRMAKFGSGRMPHMGSEFPDEAGLALISQWITSLKDGATAPDVAKMTTDELTKSLSCPSKALPVARGVASESLGDKCSEVRKAAAALPPGSVRDLFDGYISTTTRKVLGTNPRPRAILGLTGDAANGKVLFAAQKSQCATCHKIDGQGQEVGPDLSAIGKTRTKEHLLESLLEPSRRIEQNYQSYLLRTHSGKSLTGLLVKRDGKTVTIKDAQGKTQTVDADDVETLDAARQSLMPDGLLRDFTPQEAADLLEYLVRRK